MKASQNISISHFLSRISTTYLQAFNVVLSRIAIFGLLLLIFYYASVLFWQVMYPQDFKAPVVLDLPKQPKLLRQGSWNWFMDTGPRARKSVAPSKLNAKLLGVIAQGGEDEGIALIAIGGKKGKIFYVGDEVVPAIFLRKVGNYYVNLERDGRIEVLEIKRINLFSGEIPDEEEEESDDTDDVSDEPLSAVNIREALIEEPTKLTEIIKFKRVRGAKGFGFKVSPRESKYKELFDEMGFMEGDIVTSVNDRTVRELIKDPKSWQSLLKSDGINLQVMREGVVTDIFIQ